MKSAIGTDNQVSTLQSYSVTGLAEIGSQVAVTIGSTTVNATTAADGTWTAAGFIAPLVLTPTVASASVQVTDAVGNPGAITSAPFSVVPLAGNAPPGEPGIASLTAESLLGGGALGPGGIAAATDTAWSAAEATSALLSMEEPRA